ncbi:type I-C CRISPR-associated protein Cas8c/Csd1 [Woodsholea maritima]|uniref:type I-C CRISPR-associated protein Cas8c/Csd1 n=1 Tax=Woodsholea maritima TaxID=240237 RepID=UPI000370C965|nr:type I-C CRISPR-associated protein Cas8c/Csd1 [Woodsholea maritima]
MTIIAELAAAYDHLPDMPTAGFANAKIGYVIGLYPNGEPALPARLLYRPKTAKKDIPRVLTVPEGSKRTSGIASNFLWDKTAYVLGVGNSKRLEAEHEAFKSYHFNALKGITDPGLLALLAFLQSWTPQQFVEREWPEEMLDQNIVFALEADRLSNYYLHDRPAAKALWADMNNNDQDRKACLISGEYAPTCRLHPSIKGVWGAQSSGASIVSFNQDAFTSYGHIQGENAPVGELTTFKYVTALNAMLSDPMHRIQIGDASCVFWAKAPTREQAQDAETLAIGLFDSSQAAQELLEKRAKEEHSATRDIAEKLQKLLQGQPLALVAPHLAQDVRFYILGLAPNAARLSIRFWFDNNFSAFIERQQRFFEDMRVAPLDRGEENLPPLWRFLSELAVQGKRENVPPNLAGDWYRAILSGARYPLTLLSTTLMRIRTDKHINAKRVAMMKAVLIRNFGREVPVALDHDFDNRGYRLGRLFATYEYIQFSALGSQVNATLKDKFYAAASTRPRSVFAALDRNSASHLSRLGKDRLKSKRFLDNKIDEIMATMSPDQDPIPATLPEIDQALFALGYHHQRQEFFKTQQSSDHVDGEPEA